MAIHIGRREFITLLGGAAAAWPLAARGQQAERVRRIGVLMNRTTDDPDGRVEVAALVGWLQERGWTPGANLQIDYRWSGGSAERARALAAELAALAPALIMTIGASHVAAIQQVSRTPNGGLIVVANPLALVHRDAIIGLAARLRLPAVYFARSFVASGGLVSYGPDVPAQSRQAAGYIDRILRGEKPADLPVQAPTKYELLINLKTAKALGLEIPATVLARANEVIE